MERYDAVVVGAGPNGLSAAVTLARQGLSVLVIEGEDRIGGGARTDELTIPGVRHDLCSTIHPFAAGSPFLRSLPLEEHGLRWVHPEVPLAHPLTPDRVASLPADLDRAEDELGAHYGKVMRRLVADWPLIEGHVLGPLLRLPRHPLAMARFGLRAIRRATRTARLFPTPEAQALFAGCAAHAFLPLDRPLTSSFAWFLMAGAHLFGWPVAEGGSQAIADSLASYLRSLGGEVRTGWRVGSLDELPSRRLTLLDVGPEQLVRMAGDRLPASYLRRVARFRRGPSAFKVDYALDGPIPWAHPAPGRAGTVHLGGSLEEVARAEADAFRGRVNPRPFTLVSQQTAFDPTRAPEGIHTVWAYAHVPHATTADFAQAVDAQLERFAPGFGRRVVARRVTTPTDLERRNPNLIGGEIAGGAHTPRQLVFRPFPQVRPYATPIEGVFLCSSSTPPGAGTHGMCGHNAARAALAG